MEHSKIAQLLRTFSKESLRGLARFASTPFFSQRAEAAILLRVLGKSLLHDKPLPSKEQVFKEVFGHQPFNDHRLRMAMSALLQTTEKYLATIDFLEDKPAFYFRLSRNMRERNLVSAANAALKNGAEALEQLKWRNPQHHYELYKFQEENYRATQHLPQVETLDLQPLSDQLDTAFLSRKLWQACFLLAHQARYNATCDFGLLEHILPAAEKYNHLPGVSIYYHCYRALTEPSENHHFQTFKSQLLEYNDLFPPGELQDLYILAINFCTRRYNEGDLRFLQDQFDLYKIGFDKKYFLSEGELSRFTYLNAATIGMKVREYDWVETLISNYKQYLKPAYQESLFSFNMARLAYQKNNLGTALLLLQRAEYKETMLALAAKTLQMKIYYASEEHDLLDSHLQAITAFIRRKKIMGYHRDNYLNLVQFVRKLLDTSASDKKGRQALREMIEGTKVLAEKEWLLEEISKGLPL